MTYKIVYIKGGIKFLLLVIMLWEDRVLLEIIICDLFSFCKELLVRLELLCDAEGDYGDLNALKDLVEELGEAVKRI